MIPSWENWPDALSLLADSGRPFDCPAYRNAWVAAYPTSRDVSFGGRLPDGTLAAIALLRENAFDADSLPLGYGGVVASRRLTDAEHTAFLRRARRSARVGRLVIRELEGRRPAVGQARVLGTTSVVDTSQFDPLDRFAKKGRQSVRRATRAGASVHETAEPDAFLGLYLPVAARRGTVYPEQVVRRLAASGVARFHDVLIDGRAVSSLIVLVGSDHWMYWAAAQDDVGRRTEAGYLAVASMLRAAHQAGVPFVNLGASASGGADLGGVAQFKRRVGGEDRIMYMREVAPAAVRMIIPAVSAAGQRFSARAAKR